MAAVRKRENEGMLSPSKEIVTPNDDVKDVSGDLYKDALTNAKTQKVNGATVASNSGTSVDAARTDYDDLRDQNYKNLLDTQIQLEAARQGASKAMSQQMAAQGLSGTGYSGVAANGLSNAYLNALSSAQQAYNSKDIDISASERQAEKDQINSTFNNISSLLQNASSVDDMKDILKGYGIDINDDGTMSGEYYDSLDDESRKQLQIIYNLAKNKERYSGATFGDASSMLNGLTMENGESANQGGNAGIQDEINLLFSDADRYNVEGKVVKLTNGNYSSTNVAYVVYHNGKWYQTTSAAYAEASDKSEIKNGKDTSGKNKDAEDYFNQVKNDPERLMNDIKASGMGYLRYLSSKGLSSDQIDYLVAMIEGKK